ncbi:hypothetical protein CASFOL_009799 [Castilleja foliolosa]|uniref:Insecticidal crystal toxin domain-containing protein n=1 Tax=Castilleja foliolosa TaxID=1961234 RepID=A0ABD3DUQ5_9LAMI
MYVTRRHSEIVKSTEIFTTQPSSDGPNSGYLVIQDDEDSETYTCFGFCKKRALVGLPFPQNKEFLVRYTISDGGDNKVSLDHVFLIPVLNQPLSSNRYYAIAPNGEAFTCSKQEDKSTCCFIFRCVRDVKTMPLDPHNVYQQLEIAPYQSLCASRNSFFANSIASDGFPPTFLRRDGSTIHTKTPRNFKLERAQGLDSVLRARLPEFDFPLSRKSSEPFVVGKWYSPFVFVKEGTVSDQVTRSMYYEVTLEQRWEQIFTCRNKSNDTKVAIDVFLENEEVFVGGTTAEWKEKSVVNGVIWFTSYGHGGKKSSVGLREEIVERMKWEQARGGWVKGDERRASKINKVEEVKEGVVWSEFGCYALVERFNLKRIDGSLVMSYDFKHFNKLRTKWE